MCAEPCPQGEYIALNEQGCETCDCYDPCEVALHVCIISLCCRLVVTYRQGCGLGLDVSKRTSVSSRSPLGLGKGSAITSRAQDQCINSFLMGMQIAPYTVL